LKPVVTVVLALATLLTTVRPAHAQSSVATKPGFELLVPSGTVVPTGAQENDVKNAKLTAVQLSYGLRPDLVLTSTVGWARTTPLGLGPEAKLDLFTSDAGVEYRLALTWVTPLGASDPARRNDVAVLAGLRLDLR
jgi:hypothetical protein